MIIIFIYIYIYNNISDFNGSLTKGIILVLPVEKNISSVTRCVPLLMCSTYV
jgi:hypothetical protein